MIPARICGVETMISTVMAIVAFLGTIAVVPAAPEIAASSQPV
jgi:hypothetical protein